MVLKDVYVGMNVVDNVGHDIGTVQDMKIGDPQAVTAEGQSPPAPSTILGSVAMGLRGRMGDMPQEQADRLARMGFIRVKHGHLFGHEVYVAGDEVDRVEDNTVHLAIALES